MPSQAVIRQIAPTNPWKICNAQGLKQGTKEFEDCVHSVANQALKRKRAKQAKQS